MGHTADCRPRVTAADGRETLSPPAAEADRVSVVNHRRAIRTTAAASRLLPPGTRALVAVATLSAAIEHAVDAQPDGQLMTSLFRNGRICAAQLLAEIFVSADHLVAEGGAAPVSRESGKHRAVTFR